MSTKSRIESLYQKHEELEKQIEDAYTHHLPVAALKKQKLRIKDEITQFLGGASNENMRMYHHESEAA